MSMSEYKKQDIPASTDTTRPIEDTGSAQQETFYAFDIPHDSPWNILSAYHASRGEAEKISRIKEYLTLKLSRNDNKTYDKERFTKLSKEISNEYFLRTDASQYLEGEYSKTTSGKDFQERFSTLKTYLSQFSGDDVNEDGVSSPLIAAIERANIANVRRRGFAQALQSEIRDGEKVWNITDNKKWDGAEYLEQNFPNVLQSSLDATIGRLNTAIHLGKAMIVDNSSLAKEYINSMRQVDHFLESFNDRADLTLVDLMYYIGEHRDATTFRESTSGYYSVYEALVSGLSHTMPSQEKQRENVDLVHNCIDPDFQDAIYTFKLSYLNIKHDLGLSSQDIDLYGTVTGMISSVMRGYGISEIDDRFKQFLHNSGDHSLRTCITAASLRDMNISRFEHMHRQGNLSDRELKEQITLAKETATYMSKMACLHDTGEYLGELLGNNLIGRSELEERLLRSLRDQTENHIMQEIVPKEIDHRLMAGEFAHRWQEDSSKDYIRSSLNLVGVSDFNTKFYESMFDVIERLQTNHDIISQREVGRINHENRYENARTMSQNDVRYTLQYVHSKITGHKFQTTDPVDIAQFNDEEYKRRRDLEDYKVSNQVAGIAGTPLPHNPDITRVQDLPHTSVDLVTFLDERDIDYSKSLFKTFVDQSILNHTNLPLDVAQAHQAHDEALLHSVCYEMNHYARKQTRSAGGDHYKVDKATRKAIAQGVMAAQTKLKENGLALQHLQVSDRVLSKQRYRVASVNTSKIMGGFFGDSEKPNQLFEPLQGIAEGLKSVFNTVNNNVTSPLFKMAKTPMQAMMLIDNKHITENDFQRLFQIASTLEAGGDLSLGAMGMAEGTMSNEDSFDPKSLAVLNPLLTFALAKPQRHAEAIEKCYGHVLHLYGDQIAEKYGIEDSMGYLRTRENLKKGKYYKKPTDITLSGELSEKMFSYFDTQYKNQKDTGNLEKTSHKNLKVIEKAERYILREMITSQIAKTTNRILQENSPAQHDAWKSKLKILNDARSKIKGNSSFSTLAKYNMEIRFGSVGLLGAMMAGSTTGMDLGQLPLLGTQITTSTLFGANLALAGGAAFLASIKDRMEQIPHNNVFRKLENLPHFESAENGGIYIVKGATHKLQGTGHGKTEDMIHDLINQRDKTPNMFVQLFDSLIAIPVTAIRALSDRRTSSKAFENQNVAQTADSAGVLYKAFNVTTNTLNASVQSVAAVTSNMFFRRLGVLNMYMHEIREDLDHGKDPDFNIIKARIRDQLRDNADPSFLNAMANIKRKSKGNVWGKIGHGVESVMFNDSLNTVTHAILDMQHNVTSEEPKQEPD